MSQPRPSDTGNKPAPTQRNRQKLTDCAVLYGTEFGHIVASGKFFDHPSKMGARFILNCPKHSEPFVGFQLDIPLGGKQEANNATGFGLRYAYSKKDSAIEPCHDHRILVKFPRGKYQFNVKKTNELMRSPFPGAESKPAKYTLVTVSLQEGYGPKIEGLGIPYANAEDPELEAIVNDEWPIVENITLLHVLWQQEFTFILGDTEPNVANNFNEMHLTAPFDYGYGPDHSWDVKRFEVQQQMNKSKEQFIAAYKYKDDDAHLAVTTQSIIQDWLWVDQAARAICGKRFPAYFIPLDTGAPTELLRKFYIVVRLPAGFKAQYTDAWPRLTRNGTLSALLFEKQADKDYAGEWDSTIELHPSDVKALRNHPVEEYELVLLAQRPDPAALKGSNYPIKNWLSLSFDTEELDVKRKVNSCNQFAAQAEPSQDGLSNTEDRVALHKAFNCGAGYFEWMAGPAPGDVVADAVSAMTLEKNSILRPLPVVNLCDIADDKMNALFEEIAAVDRERLSKYLQKKHLGHGYALARPGFGKTTILAVVTLSMEGTLGLIFCSAPSDVAVDNFVERIYRVSSTVAARYNKGKQLDDKNRMHRAFVVRGYRCRDESLAFRHLLQYHTARDNAAPNEGYARPSPWKLKLSVAYWLLVLLRSPAAGAILHHDDNPALHTLQSEIDVCPDLARLRSVATGQITWQEYTSGTEVEKAVVVKLFQRLLEAVDIFGTTPAASANEFDYLKLKRRTKGFVVDEAANMHRSDLYCVWGNCMLPCVEGGDPRQLPPYVATVMEKDNQGNFRNLHPADGKISALEFSMGSGVPGFMASIQHRMANGLFDLVNKVIYKGAPFTYGSSCDIALPQFAVGHQLEDFMRQRFPILRARPTGKFSPFFVHCQGSRAIKDEATGSKQSRDQVQVTLDLAMNFVRTKQVNAANIVILSPYRANVKLIGELRRQHEYSPLNAMPPASTVDGYQGKEADIVFVVMGTTVDVGIGFTADERRLCVLLTRQRCGLVIVGDVNITNPAGRGKKIGGALWEIHDELTRAGRLARVEVRRA